MTNTRQAAPVAASRVARGLAWACQAATASMYLAVIGEPAAWRPLVAVDLVSTICLGSLVVSMAFLWVTSLWSEEKNFYNRRKLRIYQNASLLGHISLLFIAMVAATEFPNPVALWIILPTFSVLSIAIWFGWMHTLSLPPEDQAVIDAIHAREAQKAASAFDASQKEQRHARLSAIVTSLGYELTEATAAPKQEAPLQTWAVPSRKHNPLVYFIRNGNRLKIGTSTELKRRIRTLALRAENVVLLVNGGQAIERAFHHQFADLRIGNTEWFAYEGALVEFVTTENHRIREEQAK